MALTAEQAYALAKGYTDTTVAGGGAIKGKNCVITSIESITGGHRVNFQWTLDNGTVQTDYIDIMDGVDGRDGVDGTTCQYETLPTPSASNVGMIAQYIGATDTYTNGYFYKCVEDDGVYSWENINVQAGGGGSSNTFNEDDFDVVSDEVSLAPEQRTFTGTTAEWEELTATEKALYGIVNLTDDDDVVETYSTTEVKTNKVWIDGKPIYRRVVEIPNMDAPSPYYGTIDIGLSDVPIKSWIKFDWIFQGDMSGSHPCVNENFYESASDKARVIYELDSKKLFYHVGSGFPSRPFTLRGVLEYTKTTD